jgi:hypothetical protein
MFDPTQIPDALPITHVGWLDAVLKILGALTVLLTVLGNTLPKIWPATQTIAKLSADFRGVVPKAAAKAEAEAQLQGMTTVPQDVLPSNLPLKSDAPQKP